MLDNNDNLIELEEAMNAIKEQLFQDLYESVSSLNNNVNVKLKS